MPQSHCSDNQKGTFFSWLHIYYSHLPLVRFRHSACHGSLQTIYIMLLAWLDEHSLVHWYQQCVMVHHAPKCMCCHKAIVVITRRAHHFHDCIYHILILLWWDFSTLCIIDHLWPFILHSLPGLLSTLWFIGKSNV